jgi:hypothetical protein
MRNFEGLKGKHNCMDVSGITFSYLISFILKVLLARIWDYVGLSPHPRAHWQSVLTSWAE